MAAAPMDCRPKQDEGARAARLSPFVAAAAAALEAPCAVFVAADGSDPVAVGPLAFAVDALARTRLEALVGRPGGDPHAAGLDAAIDGAPARFIIAAAMAEGIVAVLDAKPRRLSRGAGAAFAAVATAATLAEAAHADAAQAKATAALYTDAMAHLDVPVVIYDEDDRFRVASGGARKLYACLNDEPCCARTFTEIQRLIAAELGVPADEVEDWVAARLGAQGAPRRSARDMADGRSFVVQDSFSPSGVRVSVKVDVTDVVQARAEVHAAERVRAAEQADTAQRQRRLSDALDVVDCGVLVYDEEDRLVSASAGYASVYPAAAALARPGMTVAELHRAIFSQDLGLQGPRLEAMLRTRLSGDRRRPFVGERRGGDGRTRRIADAFTSTGARVTIVQDVTDQKRVETRAKRAAADLQRVNDDLAAREARAKRDERRFRDALNAIDCSVILYDEDDRVLFISEAHKRLYPKSAHLFRVGFSVEAVHRRMLSLDVGLSGEALETSLAARIKRTPEAPHRTERSIAGRDLSVRDAYTSSGARVTVIYDMSEVRARGRELAEAMALLETKNAELGAQRDQLEQRLAELEHVRQAFEGMHEGVALYDENDRLLVLNSAQRARYDGLPDDPTGMAIRDVVAMLRQGPLVDAPTAQAREAWLDARCRRDPAAPFALEHQTADGVCLRIQDVFTPSGARLTTVVDITEQRRAAEAQRALNAELEARLRERADYRDAMEEMVEGVALFDAHDRLLFANRAMRLAAGAAAAAWREGASMRDIYAPIARDRRFVDHVVRDDRATWLERRVARTPDTPYYDTPETTNGEKLVVRDTYTSRGARLVTVVDVTPQHRATRRAEALASQLSATVGSLNAQRAELESRLRERSYYREAFEAMDIQVAIYDADDRLLLANDALRVGPRGGDVWREGAAMAEIYREIAAREGFVPPADAAADDPSWWRRRVARTPERPFAAEPVARDGRKFMVRDAYTASGGRLTTSVDVTSQARQTERARALADELQATVDALDAQRRELEARLAERAVYREAIQAMPDGVMIFDAADRLIIANAAMRRLSIEMGARMIEGAAMRDIYRVRYARLTQGRADADAAIEAMLDERTARTPEAPWANLVERADGSHLRITDAYTTAGARLVTAVDVTELQQALETQRSLAEDLQGALNALNEIKDGLEAKVHERTLQLEEALDAEKTVNTLQRRFVSMISHEFRTPLAIIDAAGRRVNRAAERGDVAKCAEHVGRIRAAIQRLVGLIEGVLETARLQEGRVDYAPAPMALAPIVREIAEAHGEVASHMEIAVDCLGEGEITADPRLVYQIVTNLVSNAIKYSGDSTRVEIALTEDVDAVTLAVRDHGVGVPADELPKLFRSFYRASTASGVVGTGIGLNLSRALAEMHGGELSFDSAVGVGSVATLRLPRVARPADVEPEAGAA